MAGEEDDGRRFLLRRIRWIVCAEMEDGRWRYGRSCVNVLREIKRVAARIGQRNLFRGGNRARIVRYIGLASVARVAKSSLGDRLCYVKGYKCV